MQSGKNDRGEFDEMRRVFAETEGEKKKEIRREMERLVSQRRAGRISLGGKLVAQWGFLLEFNLCGQGRKGRGTGGALGLGQQQYGVCVD